MSVSAKDFVDMPDMRFVLPPCGKGSVRAADRIGVDERNSFSLNDSPTLGDSPGEGLQPSSDIAAAPAPPADPEGEIEKDRPASQVLQFPFQGAVPGQYHDRLIHPFIASLQ